MTHPAKFEPDEEGSPVGTLYYDVSQRVRRVLLDGLGRVTAVLDMLDSGKTIVDEKLTFTVAIYAPSALKGSFSLEELGQLFHDFNFLAEPVSKGQAVDLDQSNLYITLTNLLAKSPPIVKNGGMEARAASLGAKSTALVAKQVLLKFVKSACEGEVRYINVLRKSPIDGNLQSSNLEAYANRLEEFLSVVFNSMSEQLRTPKDSVLLSASGWAALGLIFHDLNSVLGQVIERSEAHAFMQAISKIDWSRYNPDWINYLGGPEKDDKGRDRLGKVFGGRAVERIAEYVRNRIGLLPLLEQQRDEVKIHEH